MLSEPNVNQLAAIVRQQLDAVQPVGTEPRHVLAPVLGS